KGGYVGLPVALAAWLLRRPLILHESDAVIGLANRFTARLATRVLLGFPGSMALSKKVEVVGNPVRPFITEGSKEQGYALTGFTPDRPVLLVWGGSQGAQEINEMLVQNFSALKAVFQIIHVTGVGKKTGLSNPAYREFEYLKETLPHVYAITDLVLGRAGANSLAEVAYLQKPHVMLPLKSAANHHQEINAAYFETHGAGLVLKDKSAFVSTLAALWENATARQTMQAALSRIACRDAAEKIAQYLL
ncbi:MAG: glycosyltransferase, partial [Candidatus Peregrinibacteria bacterium]